MIRILPLILAATSIPAAFAGVDPGLAALLPGGTEMVFSIDVQESRNSQFGRFLVNNAHWSDPKLQEVMTTTGFDPRRDLLTLVVAAPHAQETARQHDNFLVLARGNFDPSKIGAAALGHGWTKQNVSGTTLYLEGKEGGRQHGFAFLDVDVAAMGDSDSIRQVIRNRSASPSLNPDLEKLMNTVSNDHDVWFAAIGAPNRLADAVGSQNGQNAGVLRAISQSSGGIKFGSTIQLSFDALTRTDKDATSLADVVRFLASAAQLKRDQNPDAAFFAPALDNLNLSAKGNAVHVTTSLPEDSLEALATHVRANRGQAR